MNAIALLSALFSPFFDNVQFLARSAQVVKTLDYGNKYFGDVAFSQFVGCKAPLPIFEMSENTCNVCLVVIGRLSAI